MCLLCSRADVRTFFAYLPSLARNLQPSFSPLFFVSRESRELNGHLFCRWGLPWPTWTTTAQLKQCHSKPTGPFTILQPHNQEISEFYVVQERRATDLEAPQLRKGREKTLPTCPALPTYILQSRARYNHYQLLTHYPFVAFKN